MTRETALLHIDACALAAQRDDAAFVRAGFMAIVSMRIISKVFWRSLDHEYRQYREHGVDGLSISFLFGHKRRALLELEEHASGLRRLARQEDADGLHEALCTLHGLRAIKGGFITQLTTGQLMCFDSVHCAQHGLDIRRFAQQWNRRDGAAQYRAFVRGLDTAQLWADWSVLTTSRDGMWAERVSLAHARFIDTGETGLSFFFNTDTDLEHTTRGHVGRGTARLAER